MEKRKELIVIGKNIRTLRKAAGFSQENFAIHIDMGRSFYGRIERGEQNISVLNLIKIALALDVEIAQILPTLSELKKGAFQ
ncbi:MAG: helix-turn-helix transcriptional regulator [Legionellales bacterium]|nr:helix-turn-helix transcriptional regulator [Legionellales bacterium]